MKINIIESANNDCIEIIDKISTEMRKIILLCYFDKMESKYKYILGLYLDSYKSFRMICHGIVINTFPKTAMLLRQLLEEVSIITVLEKNKDIIYDDYVNFFKFNLSIISENKGKQIEKINDFINLKELK